LGYTLQLPTEDRYLTTKTEMINRLCVLLGGRTAEQLVFNDSTTGAQDDLQKATHLASRMVCEFGMSDRMGLVAYKKREGETFLGRDFSEGQGYSDQTAQLIDEEIKSLIAECQEKVKGLLRERRSALDALAAALIEKEVLNGDEIERIVNGGPSGSPTTLPSSGSVAPDSRLNEGGSAPGVATPFPSPA
jgi:cell division protease FtsH